MKRHPIMSLIRCLTIPAAALACFSASPASAQNAEYKPGDLVLYFWEFGGANTYMLRLVPAGVTYDSGTATTSTLFRDMTSNSMNLANISGTLSGAFGPNWYDNAALYWGVAAVRSNSTNTTAQVDGDPNRTIYVSQARTSIGTEGNASSPGWSGFANGDMTTGAGAILQMTGRLETQSLTASLEEGTGLSNVDNQNPLISNPNPPPPALMGTAYSIFPGGVMNNFGSGSLGNFGGVNAESALDLYRILASTTASGQVGGPLREGTYEGSFVIDQGGNVSFIVVPEPGTATLLGGSLLMGLIFRRNRSRQG